MLIPHTAPACRGAVRGLAVLLAVGTSLAAQAASPDARSALREASAVARAIKGTEGDARIAAIDKAIAAYGGVAAREEFEAGPRARASYQVAELQRRKGALADAERAYARAVELDVEAFTERGLYGRAQMLRRLERVDEALALYRKVAELDGQSNRINDARAWVGRCLLDQEDVPGAVRAFEAGLQRAKRGAHVIVLCNWLAKANLAGGDLTAAEAAIGRADRALEGAAPEQTERLQKALQKMSARRALQRARDKAEGAHRAAQDLERSRRIGG